MAIYDYMTPFEEEDEPVSPAFQLSHLEHSKHSSKPAVSPDSQCFDVSAAWWNHPQPVAPHTLGPMTPHPVLLRHNQTVNPLTPHPVLLRNEVPELTHRHSSGSSTSQGDDVLTHCSSCHLLRAQSSSIAEANCWHICADIARERECPDTQSPSSADVAEARSHEPSKHHRRRHSLFYEPGSNNTDNGKEALHQDLTPLGQESIVLDAGATQLEAECTPLEGEVDVLEQETTLLDQESSPLECAHDYEDPYYPGAEERLSRQKVRQEERNPRYRVQKDGTQMWFGNARVSSDRSAEESKNEAATGPAIADSHPEVVSEVMNHEYYYGKCI